jgi:3-hydroxyisobutyrate dehydrogenase-like beta-hydroxyacid dehydrogenase
MSTKISFLGLGTMGLPMSLNLLRKHFDVRVWNRGEERKSVAAKAGLTCVSTIAEAVQHAAILCTCVSNPEALKEVVETMRPHLRRDQLIIDFSTVSVETIESMGASLLPLGVGVVDAPVTGSRGGAEKGTLVIMAGGTDANMARAKPVFDAVGEKVIHCGALGTGTQVKLAGNAVIAAMLQSFSEGLLLTAKAGVDPRKFIEVVQASGFRSPYFDFKGTSILNRQFAPHFTIDLMHKDLQLVNENAASHGLVLPTAANLQSTYQLARAAHKGALDISAVITIFEDLIQFRLGEGGQS